MTPFKFLKETKLRTYIYWKGDVRHTIQMPENITEEYEIGYYVRGWSDAYHNLQPHSVTAFHDTRRFEIYGLGYHNYRLTQLH
jgi:hypothetical protein